MSLASLRRRIDSVAKRIPAPAELTPEPGPVDETMHSAFEAALLAEPGQLAPDDTEYLRLRAMLRELAEVEAAAKRDPQAIAIGGNP